MIKNHGYPMVLNVVIHRYNIGHIKEILEMAEALGADYVELANTQYYGWSLVNRNQLMPTKEQIESLALQSEPAIKALNSAAPKKVIMVLGRLINIVA